MIQTIVRDHLKKVSLTILYFKKILKRVIVKLFIFFIDSDINERINENDSSLSDSAFSYPRENVLDKTKIMQFCPDEDHNNSMNFEDYTPKTKTSHIGRNKIENAIPNDSMEQNSDFCESISIKTSLHDFTDNCNDESIISIKSKRDLENILQKKYSVYIRITLGNES